MTKEMHERIWVHRKFYLAKPPDGFREEDGEWYVRADLRPTAAVGEGISFQALLAVLERLKSKNANPERQWYEGWNAAIKCLVNDVQAAIIQRPTPTPDAQASSDGWIGSRLHRALHTVWTKAVGTNGYVKAEWRELEDAIHKRFYAPKETR